MSTYVGVLEREGRKTCLLVVVFWWLGEKWVDFGHNISIVQVLLVRGLGDEKQYFIYTANDWPREKKLTLLATMFPTKDELFANQFSTSQIISLSFFHVSLMICFCFMMNVMNDSLLQAEK